MLICIKSIPFWRQFEDWNTNFELSTWDPTSGSRGKMAKPAAIAISIET